MRTENLGLYSFPHSHAYLSTTPQVLDLSLSPAQGSDLGLGEDGGGLLGLEPLKRWGGGLHIWMALKFRLVMPSPNKVTGEP